MRYEAYFALRSERICDLRKSQVHKLLVLNSVLPAWLLRLIRKEDFDVI